MTYSSVMEKMQNLNGMNEIEVKETILDTLVITNALMSLKNIERLISSSQNYQMRDYIPENLEHPTFVLEKGESGKYPLKVVDLEGKRIDLHVDVDANFLPLAELRFVSITVLEHTLDFFGHSMEEEQKDDFRKTLELSIEKFSTYELSRIQEDLKGFETASEEDKKVIILEVLSKIQTYLHIADLKQILPAEKYEAIEAHLREIVMAPNPEYGNTAQVEAIRERRMQASNFTISKNLVTGIFEIESEAAVYNYELTPVVAELDLSSLDLSTLTSVAVNAMEKHREAEIFHDGVQLKGAEIPQVLDVALSTFKVRDIKGQTNTNIEKNTSVKRTPDDIVPITKEVKLGFFRNIVTKMKEFVQSLNKER